MTVAVVRTGVANTASVVAALRRAGAAPLLTADPGLVRGAEVLVLPGVGAFAAGVAQLQASGLIDPLRERVEAGRPTLAICLGLQLLCASSEESPGVPGLGVLPVAVTRFPAGGVRVPQLGWNRVRPSAGCRLLQEGDAYFANSYRLVAAPPGWAPAHADHGGPFVAALERGAVLACQFHPELSSAFGQALLQRFLARGAPC